MDIVESTDLVAEVYFEPLRLITTYELAIFYKFILTECNTGYGKQLPIKIYGQDDWEKFVDIVYEQYPEIVQHLRIDHK